MDPVRTGFKLRLASFLPSYVSFKMTSGHCRPHARTGRGVIESRTALLVKTFQSIRRFSYGMRLAICEWNSTDVRRKCHAQSGPDSSFYRGHGTFTGLGRKPGPVQ